MLGSLCVSFTLCCVGFSGLTIISHMSACRLGFPLMCNPLGPLKMNKHPILNYCSHSSVWLTPFLPLISLSASLCVSLPPPPTHPHSFPQPFIFFISYFIFYIASCHFVSPLFFPSLSPSLISLVFALQWSLSATCLPLFLSIPMSASHFRPSPLSLSIIFPTQTHSLFVHSFFLCSSHTGDWTRKNSPSVDECLQLLIKRLVVCTVMESGDGATVI